MNAQPGNERIQEMWEAVNRRLRLGLASASVCLLVAGAVAAGISDTPSGSPPHGFAYSSDAAGEKLAGTVSMVFSDLEANTAFGFEAVLRLRKGNSLHNFFFADDCSQNQCGICQEGRISVTLISFIQQCLEDEVESSVIQMFGLDPAANLRLKSTSNFWSEAVPDPASPGDFLLLTVTDVEMSAK